MNRKEEIISILINAKKALTVNQIHASLPLSLKGNKNATRKALYDLVADLEGEVHVCRFERRGKMLLYGIDVEKPDFSDVPSRRTGSWGVTGV